MILRPSALRRFAVMVVAQVEPAPRPAERDARNRGKGKEAEITVEIGKKHQIGLPSRRELGLVERVGGAFPTVEGEQRVAFEAAAEPALSSGGKKVHRDPPVEIGGGGEGCLARGLQGVRGIRAEADDRGSQAEKGGRELGKVHRMVTDPQRIDQRDGFAGRGGAHSMEGRSPAWIQEARTRKACGSPAITPNTSAASLSSKGFEVRVSLSR